MKLSIAIVAHHALGGSCVMALEWAWALAAQGHEVHLIRTGTTPRDAVLASRAGAPRPNLHELVVPDHPVIGGPSELTAMASALIALHREHPLDLVHIHYALPFALLAPLLSRLEPAPAFAVSLHGTDVTGVGARPTYAPALALALRSAELITAPGPWLQQEAHHKGLVDPWRQVAILPNFVDLERFHPPAPGAPRPLVQSAFGSDDGVPVVAHVSNLRPIKRAHDSLEVLRLLREHRRARLVVVGDGPDREGLEREARALLSDDAAFVGAVDDPADWLREVDALLLPSESESFGLAALEALASGTPVVASRVDGLVDWLSDTPAARLCPVGDIRGFARALEELLPGHGNGATLTDSARELAVKVGSVDRAREILEELYEQLLSRRSRPQSPYRQ